MFSTPQPYNKKCYCAGCSQNELVYNFVARRTAQRHNKRGRLDAIRCESESSAQRNSMEVDVEPISTHQSRTTEEECGQTNLLAWEGTPVSDDENVSVTNKGIYNNKNNGDENKEDDNEDVVKVEVEEFVNEGWYCAMEERKI
ncbi:hypothetical protein PHYBLDRAFT_152561 [Phycomyces blakesleeanus NRRL 1555(-)]|uniref:Uncharacterized protein n=1 Tax=Phycomyces blakesleeanus (strain ATCC 8743b / DSM 1359 / FGSC 10004 / NBRC 33097 / NRRL 1555) TaxID=763407 RepID=A0A167JLA4_PHYB8|nr:hypothetical protein PHYBLDRAFT_152561 [Phycomyces blakesleeanus NRRL 1555(-)]OAD66237.1 hypothetical protein PHYBLDRAFT_152561 [Phycomyces blakesleeanus NRRL 1555(-)]|eukprot:XP_018284277.1 hypothetical protein PHYBLDRAFT_152561 [Phycomyces blakesleeanus NRRL 1555(-)]